MYPINTSSIETIESIANGDTPDYLKWVKLGKYEIGKCQLPVNKR